MAETFSICLKRLSWNLTKLQLIQTIVIFIFSIGCLSSFTCALTGFFWLLSHLIYLKLTKVLKECFLSQTEWWVVKVIFLSLRPEAWTFWKLNFVNPLRFTSHQKKLRKLFTFWAWKLLSDELNKTILPKCQIAFLGITVIKNTAD